ncbi:MAG: LysR family transcriptional regulator [Gammaproteobacteria bacterium]|nr:LysR family transcriptional regulator [Gammaproteobacteria bacterium]
MDINDFKTFLEVNRTRHFGHAAENLCVTQSTVSARIRQLEEQLGAKLFVRERNNIQLTAEGIKMLDYADLIVTAWGRARQELGVADSGRLSFVVGGMPSLWDIYLQGWLQQIYKENSNLIIHAEINNNNVLQKRILNGTMDLAFVFDALNNDQLTITKIDSVELVLVSSEENKTIEQAIRQDYILVDWGSSFLTQHAQQFQDTCSPILHTGLGRIALEFLLGHGGSAYLAKPMVEEYLESGQLYSIMDAPVYTREAYAIFNPGNDKQELIARLLDNITS